MRLTATAWRITQDEYDKKARELKERQTALLGEQATEADYIAWREQAKREADIIAPQIQEVTDLSAQLDRLLTMAAPIAIEIALKIANLRTVV